MTLPEIISEARELLAKATPGPWEAHISGDKRRGCIDVPDEKLSPLCSYNPNDFAYCSGRASSLEFISFARNHLSEILDELELRVEDNLRIGVKLEQQAKAIEVLKSGCKTAVGYEPLGGLEPNRPSECLAKAERILSGESGDKP